MLKTIDIQKQKLKTNFNHRETNNNSLYWQRTHQQTQQGKLNISSLLSHFYLEPTQLHSKLCALFSQTTTDLSH